MINVRTREPQHKLSHETSPCPDLRKVNGPWSRPDLKYTFSKVRGRVLEVDSHGARTYTIARAVSLWPCIQEVLDPITAQHDVKPGLRSTFL
jgi:hypothetical protein